MQYKNPILKGFHPDPSICRDDEGYYYIATSTFEYFPGVPIYRSRDLINWQLLGHCLTRKSQLDLDRCPPSGGVFAPTIRYRNGRFYMITTDYGNAGNFYVFTDDILSGEWSEPIYVEQDGIDPSLLFDGEKAYLCSTYANKTEGISLSEIDIETGKLLTPVVPVCRGSGGRFPEAPHIYRIGRYYYLLLAEGGTEYGHRATMFRSENIFGPYESCPFNPFLSHAEHAENAIQAVGHADLISDGEGNWWLVCLGIRKHGQMHHNLGRETFLAPLVREDGWFSVRSEDGCIHLKMEGPGEGIQAEKGNFFTDFSGKVLEKEWSFLRNPREDRYSLTADGLLLRGNGKRLSDDLYPSMILIRQTEFCCECRAEIEAREGCAGGLTVYYGFENHYELELRGNRLYFCRQIFDLSKEEDCGEIPPRCALIVCADMREYTFFLETDGVRRRIGSGSTAAMCSEVTRYISFTGTFFGVYAAEGQIRVKSFSLCEKESL